VRELHPILVLVEGPPEGLAEPLRTLEREGFTVQVEAARREALALAGEARLVLLVPGAGGGPARALLPRLCARESEGLAAPVLVLAAPEDREGLLEALRLGAEAVRLPVDPDELVARVRRCLHARQYVETLVQRVATLEQLSITDGLTQVHTARYFQGRLREEFRRALRYDDPLALLFLELDHFQRFTEEHGRAVGNAVLCDVARTLQRSVRETDLLARSEGGAFSILLPRTSLTGALTLAERVWRELAALPTGPGGALRVTASLGVSGFPHHAVHSSEQLVRTAEQALSRAQREGHNRICLHAQVPLLATAFR
jgi:diguanylate cyclase (GGDEF)-like protein